MFLFVYLYGAVEISSRDSVSIIIILLQLTFNIDDLETRAELALDAFCSNDHHKVVTIFTWMER